jgi:four helix bundle protein
MRLHHELRLWRDAMALVRRVYEFSKQFPGDERFGLTAQIRRCAVSIPSNIAEGAARSSRKEFAHYLMIARGSLSELDTPLRIAHDLGFADATELIRETEPIFASLAGLLRSQTNPSRAAQPRPNEAAQRPT